MLRCPHPCELLVVPQLPVAPEGLAMMLDPETRSVFLADAQLEAGAWRIPDADEADLAACCEVCATPLLPARIKTRHGTFAFRKVRPGTRVCNACIRNHWRSAACVICGGVTRSWDWSSKKRAHRTRGVCGTCRDTMHVEVAMPSGGRKR